MAEFSKQYESLMRNKILATVYGSLPSYCVWTEDDILDEDTETRLNWWRKMISEAVDNDIDVEKKNETHWPFVSIRGYGIKWVNAIKKQENKNKAATVLATCLGEYCSKRQGGHLNCDI
jgi:hypothetical protein